MHTGPNTPCGFDENALSSPIKLGRGSLADGATFETRQNRRDGGIRGEYQGCNDSVTEVRDYRNRRTKRDECEDG